MKDSVEAIAKAVLYEGFLLYPYRTSSLKNSNRASFGMLYPPAYCEAEQNGEKAMMQSECLFQEEGTAVLTISLRFLQWIGDRTHEREVSFETSLPSLNAGRTRAIDFPPLRGTIESSAHLVGKEVYRLRTVVRNETSFVAGGSEEALRRAFASAHMILRVKGGRFLSLIDPPAAQRDAAAQCRNIGCWPVLAGDESKADTVLSAPIVLYDYPKVAPQSAGDLFDGTEIDEILSLRVLTLTEEEKQAMRSADPRAKAVLERTENLAPKEWAAMHGSWDKKRIQPFQKGDRVRLRPRGRADALDILLKDRLATVESVEQDFENRIHLAVSVDDDPGKDLAAEGRPGHRFFFRPDEVERLP